MVIGEKTYYTLPRLRQSPPFCQLCRRIVDEFSVREEPSSFVIIMTARCHGRIYQQAFERELVNNERTLNALIGAIQWFGEDARRLSDFEPTRTALDYTSRNQKSTAVAGWPSGKRLIQLDD